MRHALIGQSYMFGLLSVNPSLSSVLRKFRDTGLQRLTEHFGLPVTPSPTTHRILVIMKREEDIYSEVAESLCRMVTQRVQEISRYVSSENGNNNNIEVDCFSPFAVGYNFITEVEKVRSSTIIVTESGTLGLAALMSRDGTNLIAVGWKKYRKDGNILMFATHFKTTWVSTDERIEERMDAALIRALTTTRFLGNNGYTWKFDKPPKTSLKDGLYVKSSSYNPRDVNASIFLVLNDTFHLVQNIEPFYLSGFQVGDVRVFPKHALDLLTVGDPLTGYEEIHVCKSKVNIYLDRIPVYFETISLGALDNIRLQHPLNLFCRKYQVNDTMECDQIGNHHLTSCKADIHDRAQFKDGLLVKPLSATTVNTSIFMILNDTRRLVENVESLFKIGFRIEDVRVIPMNALELLPIGVPLTGDEDIHVCRTPLHFAVAHTSAIFETISVGEIDISSLQSQLNLFCEKHRMPSQSFDNVRSYHVANCRNEMQTRNNQAVVDSSSSTTSSSSTSSASNTDIHHNNVQHNHDHDNRQDGALIYSAFRCIGGSQTFSNWSSPFNGPTSISDNWPRICRFEGIYNFYNFSIHLLMHLSHTPLHTHSHNISSSIISSTLIYKQTTVDVCWINHEFVFYDDTTHKIPDYLKISSFGGRDVDFQLGNNIRSGFLRTPQTEWKPRILQTSMPLDVSYDADKAFLYVESSYSDNFGKSSLVLTFAHLLLFR